MSKRLIMFFTIIFIFVASILIYNFDKKEKNFRYQQHIEDAKNTIINEENEIRNTHLPIISITVNEEKIPGESILGSDGNEIGRTLDSKGNSMTLAEMNVYDNGTSNTIYNKPKISSSILIRYRGNSSIHFMKRDIY